jgi:hypothetical protein
MIKYKFVYQEFDDDADPDLAEMATRHIEVVIAGQEDKKWSELLPFMEDWLRASGFAFNGHLAMVTSGSEENLDD